MKKAFTLAEVLITLSIIGVIASMTIPSLIQDVQDAQYKTAWKKTYAELEQATKRVLLDNGGTMKNFSYPNCSSQVDTCFKNTFVKYFNSIKECDSVVVGICWHNYGQWKTLKGDNVSSWDGYDSGIIINNGVLLNFTNYQPACSSFIGTTNLKYCGNLLIDINGFKGPNTVGKDIFRVWLSDKKIFPFGTQGDGNEATCDKSGTGWGCSAKYLYQ